MKKEGITVISLFDGMSCGQIALDELGVSVDKYYASEIKPYGIQVTQHNYPNTIQIGDVTKLEYKDGKLDNMSETWEVGDVDLFIGGSPCSQFSAACIPKRRLGLKGKDSSLFYEYLRLLKEVKPRYFLLENVGSMKKSDQDAISDYLGVQPIKINSKVVTAQLRNRLYWTNIPQVKEIQESHINLSNILESGYTDREKARALLQSDSRPLADPLRMFHRYYSTGFLTLVFKDKNHYDSCKAHYDKHFKGMSAQEITDTRDSVDISVYNGIRLLTQTERERLQGVPEGYTSILTENQAASLLGDGWTVPVIKHLFSGLLSEIQKGDE